MKGDTCVLLGVKGLKPVSSTCALQIRIRSRYLSEGLITLSIASKRRAVLFICPRYNRCFGTIFSANLDDLMLLLHKAELLQLYS